MPQKKIKKQSKLRRKFNLFRVWFATHKIRGWLLIILVVVVGYLGISEIVWRTQIYFEHRRFVAASQFLDDFARNIPNRPSLLRHADECRYTTNGAVFSIKHLGCQSNLEFSYSNISKKEAIKVVQNIETSLKKEGIVLTNNTGNQNPNDISEQTFKINNLSCGIEQTFYSDNIASIYRFNEAIQKGDVLFISMGCSGAAKAEYFPVTKY